VVTANSGAQSDTDLVNLSARLPSYVVSGIRSLSAETGLSQAQIIERSFAIAQQLRGDVGFLEPYTNPVSDLKTLSINQLMIEFNRRIFGLRNPEPTEVNISVKISETELANLNRLVVLTRRSQKELVELSARFVNQMMRQHPQGRELLESLANQIQNSSEDPASLQNLSVRISQNLKKQITSNSEALGVLERSFVLACIKFAGQSWDYGI
jgi:hypothetical protein